MPFGPQEMEWGVPTKTPKMLFRAALSPTISTRMQESFNAQFLTAAEIESILARIFGSRLLFSGFEAVASRKWVQETDLGFKYLFLIHPQRNGAAYYPSGAISLDFVPRLVAGEFKMRPKPKHAAVHFSFETGKKTRWDWMIDKSRETFGEKVERIAAQSVTEITGWFQRFNSVIDIVAAIDEAKRTARPVDFYCYPDLVLAYTFALARVRRIPDAKSEFEHVLKSKFYDVDLLPQLESFFEAEIKTAET
ncbi:MAG TPA: hypothetical protein VJA21_07970 [Verrucomicrobiae bacterium]